MAYQQYSPNNHHDPHMGPMPRNNQYHHQSYNGSNGQRHHSHSMSNRSNSYDHPNPEMMNTNHNGEPSAPPDPSHCGLPALKASRLDRDVVDMTIELFQQDHDLELSYIEPPSIRLLEEISAVEQKAAIREFVERFKKAKHKIKKSRPGYFRGVCQKYWKQNRERKKCELLRRANMDTVNEKGYGRNNRGRISKLIAEAIELLFTPASGLETTIIDESIERRFTQLSDQQGIQALYEFCSAVMYRQERIRNMNAYLMNIITRQMEKQTRGGGRYSRDREKANQRNNNDHHDNNEPPPPQNDGNNRDHNGNHNDRNNDNRSPNGPNNDGYNNGYDDQYNGGNRSPNGDQYQQSNDQPANFDVNVPPHDAMNPGNFPPNGPMMYGPNGWPLGPPPPGYMMPNMGMNGPHPMNPMGGMHPMSPMNGMPMNGMPMNMPPNGAFFPMHGPGPYNQFMPTTPHNASLPMSAYFPIQPAASGPLQPMNGSVPAKAVAAAANASTNNSANPFLSASSVLSPHLFPPSNIPISGNMPPNSITNPLQSPSNALVPPTNSNLNLPSNPTAPVKDKKHLVQELKRLVDGVSLGSTPNESVHGGSVPSSNRRNLPELEVRKSRKLDKKIPYKPHKNKDRSPGRPQRIPLGSAARRSNQKSFSSADDDDSVHQQQQQQHHHHKSPSKTLAMPKNAQDFSDSDHMMSSQGQSVSHQNSTEQGTMTGDDDESGGIQVDHRHSTVDTSSAAIGVADNDDNIPLMIDDENDRRDPSRFALDPAVIKALEHETATQAARTAVNAVASKGDTGNGNGNGDDDDIGFGGMINETDSEMSGAEEEVEEDDDAYFNMDTDSVNSSDLPKPSDLQNQFISASDGYVIKEQQEKRNAFRKDPFRAHLRLIQQRNTHKKKGGRHRSHRHHHHQSHGHHVGDNVLKMIGEKKRKEKEEKTKRIMSILKDLRKTPHGIEDLVMSSDENSNGEDETVGILPSRTGSKLNGNPLPQNPRRRNNHHFVRTRAKHGDFNEREMEFLASVAKESVKESNDHKVSRRLALSNSKSMDHRSIPHHPPPGWGYAQPPPGFPQRSRQLGPYQGPPPSHSHGQYGPYPMHHGHGGPPPHPHGPPSRYHYYGRAPLAPLDHVDEMPPDQMALNPPTINSPIPDSPKSDPTPGSPKRSQFFARAEGLADSGPNCPVDRMQDRIRLKQLMEKQHSNKYSTSETKSSAENNRRKLNDKLVKMGAEDEEEMLNDELFVETARLLKEDSLRRKKNAQKQPKRSRQSRSNTPFITADGQNNPIPPLPNRGRDHEDAEVSRRPTLQYFRSCGPPLADAERSQQWSRYYQQYGYPPRGHHSSYYGHPPGFGPPYGHHRQQMLDQQAHSAHPAYHPPNGYHDRRDHFGRHLPLREVPDEDNPNGPEMSNKGRQPNDGDDSGLLTYLGAFEPSRPIDEEENNESNKPALSLYHKSSPADFLCPPRPDSYTTTHHKQGRDGGPVPPPISVEPPPTGDGRDSRRGNAFLKAYAAHFDAVSAMTPTGHIEEERDLGGHPGPKPVVDPHAASNPVSLQGQGRRQLLGSRIRTHHEMTLSPPDNQETTNSSGSTGSGGSDEVDSELEELQRRQHPHQSLNDSYSYHPFSRGDDDQKKAETESNSPSKRGKEKRTKTTKVIEEEVMMSSPEGGPVVAEPIPVADTIEDIDEEWVCSDYDGNDMDGNQNANRVNVAPHLRSPLPQKSNDRRLSQQRNKATKSIKDTPYKNSVVRAEEKAEEISIPMARSNRRSPPSPPRVNYKRGNAFGTMDCHKFPDTKSIPSKSAAKTKKPRPNRPTKPPLKLNKAARTSKRVSTETSKQSPSKPPKSKQKTKSPPKKPMPSPKLVDRASKPMAETKKSKLEDRASTQLVDRASTNIDGDVATLSLSHSRASCKAPENEYEQRTPRKSSKNKSKRKGKRNKNWNKKEQKPIKHGGDALSLDAKHFVPQQVAPTPPQPASQPNQIMYGAAGISSTPNSVFALPFMSSVPLQCGTPSVASMGSMPMASTPTLNRAMTAPMNASQESTQLKQLENTVEQLKSHFVQLLQHLPLTPGQQNDFRNQPQIAQLLSGPNTGSSMPNVVMTSAPNVGLGNVTASHLLNTNGANIVVQKNTNNGASKQFSRGRGGITNNGGKKNASTSGLNHGAKQFVPRGSQARSLSPQYHFPTSLPMTGAAPLLTSPMLSMLTPNAMAQNAMSPGAMATSNETVSSAMTPNTMTSSNPSVSSPPPMQFHHSDPYKQRGGKYPLKQRRQ